MTHTIAIAVGSEGAWIERLDGSDMSDCVQLSGLHTLDTLGEWLASPGSFTETYVKASSRPSHHRAVYFDLVSGKLVIHHPVKSAVQFFDPGSEDSMAKFVRVLKRFAEKYEASEEQGNLDLPVPTAAQMANRTIATQVGVPDGVGTYRRPKQRYNAPTASALKTKEILDGLLAKMIMPGG